jgi:hypothetical protein
MKVKTQVKAGQLGVVSLGVAVIGQGVGTGNPTNSGQIGVINVAD